MQQLKHILRMFIVALLLWPSVAAGADLPATAPAFPATRPISREDVDRVVTPLVESEWGKSLVVGVIDETGGRRIYGYGRVGDADSPTPDGKTVYEIGSVTKSFTATLLADRVVRGKMSLDDPAQKYLPETVKLPQVGKQPITLTDLATH